MKRIIGLVIMFILSFSLFGQKVIFLHHSTGSGVYYDGNVAQWIANYNTANGTSYQISERSYPDTPYPWANYPYDYWKLWINGQCNNTDPDIECLDKLTQNFDVIIFKHCFPGASIQADDGNPLVSSEIKTINNYKLQYRALRTLMDSYPTKKFIIWTLVPLHRLATNPNEASRAKQFVDWVKTAWLTEDGKSHPNIHIFDFFSYAAESNPAPVNGQVNCLKYIYELDHNGNDSHPNLFANQTIGPIFAQFIVNTIGNPTQIETIVPEKSIKIYPNPASDEIFFDFSELGPVRMDIEIIDINGKSLLHKSVNGHELIKLDSDYLNSGIYILKANLGIQTLKKRFLIFH